MNQHPRLVVLVVLWFAAATLYYVYGSIDVILRFAPHALYADQWRQYAEYLSVPFPQNMWRPDNGHRLVLPNLVAWIELQWFSGDQWLQIGVGILCGLGAAATAAWVCLRDREIPVIHRAAAAFLCFFAIFWLANVRTLFHSTELLHTRLPMACLMLALALCIRATQHSARSLPAMLMALAFGFAATFSFGYGLSVFLGSFAVLIARKADRRLLGACVGGLLLAAGLYLGSPGSAGVTASMGFAPLENLVVGMRWLGAPFVTLFGYLWDPNSTGLVPPGPARYIAGAFANTAAAHGIDLHVSVMPQALFGALGMFALAVASFKRLRATEAAGPMEALGLGIAWFGLGAAGIVSLSRLGYFHEHPDQIYADRYLCWPCLFWLGLALVGLSRAARRQQVAPKAKPRPALIATAILTFTLPLPLLAWPTQYGGSIYAALVRGHIDNIAAASVVGVVDRKDDLGDTMRDEFVRGLPVIAEHRVAQFAFPAVAWMDQILPADRVSLDGTAIETRPIPDNLLGEPGTGVVVRAPQASSGQLLLIDGDRRVVGLVVRDARLQPPGYSGYARGVRTPEQLGAVPVP